MGRKRGGRGFDRGREGAMAEPGREGPELELLAFGAADFRRLAADPVGSARRAGYDLGSHAALVQAVATNSAAFQERGEIRPPWGGYLALEGPSRVVVGTCGFKGGPDPEGAVEIAYFTFPGGEGRGIGSAMARALCMLASRQPGVRVLRAHTLPDLNTSARLLARLGFVHTADIADPEDGPVWRWHREPFLA
ncbi:MAG: GNAT family N-acetyltransferase [Gemmatimonadota bacterium]